VPESRFHSMLAKLKTRGHRLTPQRLAVLRYLAESTAHPSVEEIYRSVKAEFPTTSLATVYKTVALLKELGEAMELGFSDGGNRYDGFRPYPHPHLVCTRCRKIVDPDLAAVTDLTAELARESGFRILTHRMDFFGICPDCQKRASH
jgi:Fur family peroxide stress response transcriptional regulator